METLTLKWGSLKAWDLNTEASLAALRKYWEGGKVAASAISQRNTEAQKDALCELIDVLENEHVHLDWDGVDVSKEEAKKYIREYDSPKVDS